MNFKESKYSELLLHINQECAEWLEQQPEWQQETIRADLAWVIEKHIKETYLK